MNTFLSHVLRICLTDESLRQGNMFGTFLQYSWIVRQIV